MCRCKFCDVEMLQLMGRWGAANVAISRCRKIMLLNLSAARSHYHQCEFRSADRLQFPTDSRTRSWHRFGAGDLPTIEKKDFGIDPVGSWRRCWAVVGRPKHQSTRLREREFRRTYDIDECEGMTQFIHHFNFQKSSFDNVNQFCLIDFSAFDAMLQGRNFRARPDLPECWNFGRSYWNSKPKPVRKWNGSIHKQWRHCAQVCSWNRLRPGLDNSIVQ